MQMKSQIRSIGIDLGKTTFHLVALGGKLPPLFESRAVANGRYDGG